MDRPTQTGSLFATLNGHPESVSWLSYDHHLAIGTCSVRVEMSGTVSCPSPPGSLPTSGTLTYDKTWDLTKVFTNSITASSDTFATREEDWFNRFLLFGASTSNYEDASAVSSGSSTASVSFGIDIYSLPEIGPNANRRYGPSQQEQGIYANGAGVITSSGGLCPGIVDGTSEQTLDYFVGLAASDATTLVNSLSLYGVSIAKQIDDIPDWLGTHTLTYVNNSLSGTYLGSAYTGTFSITITLFLA